MSERSRPARVRPAPVPPPEASELVACMGPALTIKLIEAQGGLRIYVPYPAGVPGSTLAAIVGEEALLRLAQRHGGCKLTVPLCREWRVRMYLHEGGRSHAEIARLVGCSWKRVQYLSHADWTPMKTSHKQGRTANSDERQTVFGLE